MVRLTLHTHGRVLPHLGTDATLKPDPELAIQRSDLMKTYSRPARWGCRRGRYMESRKLEPIFTDASIQGDSAEVENTLSCDALVYDADEKITDFVYGGKT